MAKAQRSLAMIDEDREIARLIQEEGWDDQRILANFNIPHTHPKWIRQLLAEGQPVRPLTPRELGWRRMVEQISTEEMMTQLKNWPYTFGTLHYDAWEAGTWDDVGLLRSTGLLSMDEYREIRSVISIPDDHITN